MAFDHPRREEVDAYQAQRIGCAIGDLRSGGTSIVRTERDPASMVLFQAPDATVLVTHHDPTSAVRRALEGVPRREPVSPENLLERRDVSVEQRGLRDLTLYLDPHCLQTVRASGVRALTGADAPTLERLRDAVDPRHRWYVEPDHEGLFGLFRGEEITAAASHLRERGHAITDIGVLTCPAHRRQGHGRAVVSAAVDWGNERHLLCQWVTTDANAASLALARSLGFSHYGTETELHCLDT